MPVDIAVNKELNPSYSSLYRITYRKVFVIFSNETFREFFSNGGFTPFVERKANILFRKRSEQAEEKNIFGGCSRGSFVVDFLTRLH